MTQRHAVPLQTIAVTVPEPALEAYEAALGSACETVGFFRQLGHSLPGNIRPDGDPF